MKPESHSEATEKWRKVTLSAPARARMEHELLEYARFHGVVEGDVRAGQDSRSIERVPHTIGISVFTRLSKFKLTHMTALILIALLAGGGTSFAAERAVPGDALYPVKVEVNEEIKSIFAIGNDAEARLQAELLEERLEEAETLAAEGRLSSDVAAELSARMKAHAEDAEARSKKAETEGSYESAASVRASLQGALASHARVLASLRGENGGMADIMKDIHAIATGDVDATANVNATVEAEARAEVESTLDTAAELLDEAKSTYEDAKPDLTSSVKANVEARLDEGARIYGEADASLKADAYQSAYAAAERVMRIANEVRAMLESSLRIKVNLDTTGTSIIKNDIKVDSNTGGKSGTPRNDIEPRNPNANVEVESNTSVESDIQSTSVDSDIELRSNTSIGL